MSDDMALFLICIAIMLFFVYRFSKRGGGFSGETHLDPGIYRIGEDLGSGQCDVEATSGGGEIRIKERGKKEPINTFKLSASSATTPSRYRNLNLRAHDTLEVSGNLHLVLRPPNSISEGQEIQLTLGVYKFGADVPPAKYDLKALSGEGKFSLFEANEKEAAVSQEMGFSHDEKPDSYHNLLCEEGSRLEVNGTLKLELTKSKKQRGRMQKVLDFLNQDP